MGVTAGLVELDSRWTEADVIGDQATTLEFIPSLSRTLRFDG
jgi:hypothetical protein